MNIRKNFFAVLTVICLVFCGCRTAGTDGSLDWSDSANWYQSGNPVDENKVDVIYFASTVVSSETDESGNPVFRILLTEEEAYQLDRDANHYKRDIFVPEYFNFFSPHYRQATMEVLSLPVAEQQVLWDEVAEEVCDAFDYYMENINNGRKYILAGYSQGAIMVLHVLKHMTDEQYSRMVEAVMIGYGINEEDISHPHVNPAQSADDFGVVISFNSVYDSNGIYAPLVNNAAATINPTTWSADTASGQTVWNDIKMDVAIDPANNVLVVSGYDFTQMADSLREDVFPKGCLHLLDFRIYEKQIRQNAIHRAYNL